MLLLSLLQTRKMRLWKSEMQNALLILGNVATKMSATLPLPPSAGAGHFDRHQSELQLGVLILVSGKMAQAKTKWAICPQRHRQIVGHVVPSIKFAFCNLDAGQHHFTADQTAPSAVWFHLAFLLFFGAWWPNLALSPYFCASGRFDRILEIGEQTGPLQENFKLFLKMVPLYLRFFSY